MKYLLLYIIVVSNLIFTAHVDLFTANKIVSNLNKQFNLSSNKNSITVKSIETISSDSYNLIYIYHLNPVGFVLISADSNSEPYLGYSFESNFKTDNMPANVSFLIDSYKEHILNNINLNKERTVEVELMWDEFTDDNYEESETRDVSPLLDAEFDQSGAWNNALTEFGFYGPVGCVAVSMSQIMHYWSFILFPLTTIN